MWNLVKKFRHSMINELLQPTLMVPFEKARMDGLFGMI